MTSVMDDREAKGRGTIEERWERFHADHPDVGRALIELARDLVAMGHDRLGLKMLWEVLRYNTYLGAAPGEEPYRLCNDYTAYYARWIMDTCPDLDGKFVLRELRA